MDLCDRIAFFEQPLPHQMTEFKEPQFDDSVVECPMSESYRFKFTLPLNKPFFRLLQCLREPVNVLLGELYTIEVDPEIRTGG